MSYLTDYEEIDGGYVAFGGNPKEKKSQENVPLKLNSVLFNDAECIILSPNFKLIDETQVLLKVHRKNNMYSVDLKNIVPKEGLTCLFAKATSDESKLWHRRLGHLNFKTMNKLVKKNLVRGLPSKLFEYDQTCVACQKEKQHRASYKTKTENSISLPLHLLHMDLFGPTFVKSFMKKMHCLVVTDDFCRLTWFFFLDTKDETSGILKSFITRIENLVDHKVKVIRCDNMTEFKNREMNQFCEMKGNGPDWLFNIDALTRTINYEPIVASTHSNGFAGTKACDNAGQASKETEPVKDYIILSLWIVDPPFFQDPKSSQDDGLKPSSDDGKKVAKDPSKRNESYDQEKEDSVNNTNNVNFVGTNKDNELSFDSNMPALKDVSIFDFTNEDEDDDAVADMNNLDTTIQVSPTSTTRIHKDHPLDQVIGDLHSATQTRRMA
nr:putative ribonuclease H-like domain-containing protein [Tanacetum cinerariifolium]